MKLYSSIGPNPRLVNMLLAEKALTLPCEQVDIVAGVNRQPDFLALNPTGTTPVLLLDDGTGLAETWAICEYLEELYPDISLIGRCARERAVTRMWWRRVDLAVVQPLTAGFRAGEGLGLFKERVRCYPSVADELKCAAQEGLAWLDGQLGDQSFFGGERLSVADLQLFVFVEFGALVGQALDAARCPNLARWLDTMSTRHSAISTR
ncbi:Glutathione S-transferase GST-6.0 [compost metagenome]